MICTRNAGTEAGEARGDPGGSSTLAVLAAAARRV